MSPLWIPATIGAAAAQTARNATQRGLTGTIGTAGATQVRFLYGLPFALIFLAGLLAVTGAPPPHPGGRFSVFVLAGSIAQILATMLLLWAMHRRAFGLVTAYSKTEPIQVALVGIVLLGEWPSRSADFAMILVTAGVALAASRDLRTGRTWSALLPALSGLLSGALFAISAVSFRGAILALDSGTPLLRSAFTVAVALVAQSVLLVLYLSWNRPLAITGSLAVWRSSIAAGFYGAAASELWFLGFALTTAANVRTLALIELLFAQIVSQRIFRETMSRAEAAGLAMVALGLLVLTVL